MKPSEISRVVETGIQASIPVFIHGKPGVGKSDVIKQAAAAHGYGIIDLRLLLLDPTDLRGLPFVVKGEAKWSRPVFLPKEDKPIVIILEELSSTAPLVQNASLQMILDYAIGEHDIPRSVRWVATGNRASDRAYVTQLSGPLANRFLHAEMDEDLNDFCDWGFTKGQIRPEIIAFLRFRPKLLHTWDDKSKNAMSFASPRTWAMLSRAMDTAPDKDMELNIYGGLVGEGAAVELISFMRIYRELPSIDAILMDPLGQQVPNNPATLYAVCSGLASKSTVDAFGAICAYSQRLPVEYMVCVIKDAIKVCPDVVMTQDYIQWVSKNQKHYA